MESQFEFEQWARLARENPEEFERQRAAAIEAVIVHAPAGLVPRLRGLQFRLDAERRKARTPLGAAVRIQSLMWDQFEQLRAALNELTVLPPDQAGRTAAEPGKVLSFPSRE